jgi:UDP-4-amino-4,6-dideoxy-N-acetyl-beta-L-altrosamine N-acetyltransferase
MSNGDVSFRRICESDLVTLRAWRNSPEVARHMYTDHKISEGEHQAWFEGTSKNASASYWIIEWRSSSVGLVNVVEIDFQKQSASWAFYLGKSDTRGKGIGLVVEYCVLAYVFDYLDLETLRCEVLETNPDVCTLHESVGFGRTGRLLGRATKGGESIDAIAYAMTKVEWNSMHRFRLEERIRNRGRDPLPLLSALQKGGPLRTDSGRSSSS